MADVDDSVKPGEIDATDLKIRNVDPQAMNDWRRSTPTPYLPGQTPPTAQDPAAAGATQGLADVTAGHIASTTKVSDEMDRAFATDRARIQKAFDETGIGPNDLKPFDSEQARAQFTRSPLQAFGSLGSVFGLVASAFTRQPLTNGLNAAASAMEAIKKGDDQAYQRSFDEWKANTDLAVKRQNIQHQHYQDALQLLNTDMAIGTAKMRTLAARFGDQQTLELLDRGMSKEVIEIQGARQRMATELALTMEKINEGSVRQGLYEKWLEDNPDSGVEEKAQFATRLGIIKPSLTRTSPQQELLQRYLQENPTATAEQIAEYAGRVGAVRRPPDEERKFQIQEQRQSEVERHNLALETIASGKGDVAKERQAEVERHNKAMEGIQSTGKGGATQLTTERQVAADVATQRKKWEEEGLPPDQIATKAADLTRQLKQRAASVTGNQADQLASNINRIDYSLDVMDKAEGLMKKHNAITGLGGKITRPAEIVGNIFGSSETDRKQFERYITELQEWGGRLMNETKGRPLAAEASKINTIIAGLAMGDTVPSTARQMNEIRELYRRMRADLAARREGTYSPDKPTAPLPAKPEAGKRPAWMDAQ